MDASALIVAVVTGAATSFGTWFVIKDHYRHELYKEKLTAYKLIRDTIGQVGLYGHLATKKPDVYTDAWNTSKYNLTIDLFQNELVVSDKIAKMSVLFSRRKTDFIASNKEQYFNEMRGISTQMRRELSVRLLGSADSPLIHLSLDTLVAHFKIQRELKERIRQEGTTENK